MEIITDTRLEDRLTATLRLMGIEKVSNFNIYQTTVERRENKNGENKRPILIEQIVVTRMESCLRTSRNEQAKKWYTEKLQEASKRLNEKQGNNNATAANTTDTGNTQKKNMENEEEQKDPTQSVQKYDGWSVVKKRKIVGKPGTQCTQHQDTTKINAAQAIQIETSKESAPETQRKENTYDKHREKNKELENETGPRDTEMTEKTGKPRGTPNKSPMVVDSAREERQYTHANKDE